jgi:formate/nitrite transporter FocA (FNT family)
VKCRHPQKNSQLASWVNHVIAGSTKILFLVATGAESWGFYLRRFLVPTLVGNIIGGVSLVAFLGHAQVVAGKEA